MKVGLFFGSFNPVHNGHMMIANYFAEFTDLEQVWLVVSPHNPLKPAGSLLNDYQRLHLVEAAIGSYKKIKISKIEFGLPKPSYTINTLVHLNEKFPQHEFVLIMGSDNLVTFHKWKNFEQILENYKIYIYPRPDSDGGELKNHPSVKIIQAPLIEISSTFIRQAIKEGKDVRFYLPESVYDYIDEMNFYKK
ncbi:MAG: nicotinate-nucleotide adenylyltransferase [Bacteroidetes bacterium]|jgi:nicotinate-nucleotide adenylyltransferase|nr:nicotinate-nucleotide adenylyltransferase [Bacteroidota bacterium]MBX7238275.1 nicotinate-nucleotide adenylyltransferase [Bacteroidia bacterium]MCC7513432.1 nicotinate-nucleotide adenylyltransferase [Bacteroidia bacterium]MCW5918382.1 nicotinate-nucleotide adenylyltransferase [Bacteroidota bacterium]HMU76316.1 nicotinate (nicotinamide) nucleotide adenylyltransferase [Bacteroidia bacterium]